MKKIDKRLLVNTGKALALPICISLAFTAFGATVVIAPVAGINKLIGNINIDIIEQIKSFFILSTIVAYPIITILNISVINKNAKAKLNAQNMVNNIADDFDYLITHPIKNNSIKLRDKILTRFIPNRKR